MSTNFFNNRGTERTPGIVTGRGGETDSVQDREKSEKVQVALLGKHGPGVDPTAIGLSVTAKSATGSDQVTCYPALDYGTIVEVLHRTGDASAVVYNTYGEKNENSGQPGNMNLIQSLFGSFMTKKDGRKRPPDFNEVMERGALIRKIVEKGDWFHDLTKGIATHAAFAQIAGNFLPSIKSVPTALQKHSQIPTTSMLSQLPGQIQSLGQMLSSIMNNRNDSRSVTKNMPQETLQSLNSLIALTQNGTYESLGGSMIGDRVNLPVWKANAIELLKQAKTTSDLLEVMSRLSYDESLHGLDQLESVTFDYETPFGNVTLSMDVTGNISEMISNTVQQSIDSFSSEISSASSSHSAGWNQQPLFGESAQKMFEMAQRLPQEAQQKFKTMMDNLNKNNAETPIFNYRRKKTNGEKPLEQSFPAA